ncbi:MAG: RagB/SusD family nutrient uptake outer membrane protein [Tannerella sp.]|jgi:hypothetical protein|nr:RagB/SusD family nutrient uptake outer membrane protein [Tannerella sp.]
MKNKYLTIILGIILLSGCEDYLDTYPEGETITEDQKKESVEANPSLLSADVAAMNAIMIARMGINANDHSDFGYAASCMSSDCGGADMTCANIGYNWFSGSSGYDNRVYTNRNTIFIWNFFYKHIAAANLLLNNVPEDAEDAELKAYRGMALAVRAFDYMNLAQRLQFTYVGHENDPCVPIVTEKTTSDEAMNNPRASVSAVYELIMNDLDEAINLLRGYQRQDKGYVNQGVAFGLRARANLLTGKYAEAAADADSALVRTGATPYTLEEVSVPTFWNANDRTVMWANIITDVNDIVTSSIINMPSHLCSFFTGGYVGVGAWKKINKPLFDRIPSTDIRKQWWLNENGESSLCAGSSYDAWRATASNDGDFGAYTNVKFGADNNDLVKLTPAQDWFLMRAEEMIFIRAEGLAMSGRVAEGVSVLEDFVRNNRNSAYRCTATAPDAVRDEIWFQRRVELWGEGFALLDIMRLKKPVTRIENGVTSFPAAWQFNIPAEDPIMLYRVPKAEIEANDGISENDNNKAENPPTPTPV